MGALFVPLRDGKNASSDTRRLRKLSFMDNEKKSAVVMRQIDENLRRVYQEAASEEIPDRFQQLLERLKEQDRKA